MKRYGLVGRTLTHSFSKDYFTKKFAAQGLTGYSYQNFELRHIGELAALLASYPNLKGLNVTIPYKEEVLPYLTQKNEIVAAVGACNCIKIDGAALTGYNTDVTGFQHSLQPQLKPHHTQALVLGTGGAAKAICFVLQQLGISYQLVSRSQQHGGIGYHSLNEELLSCSHLIINTTPVGMYPTVNACPPIPYQYITPRHFLFDVIYNPATTLFLQQGQERGAQVCNGYGMLVKQAEESWRIWNGGS